MLAGIFGARYLQSLSRPSPKGHDLTHSPKERDMNSYPVNMNIHPEVEPFFDPATNTISYVVKDPNSDSCAVVDSVMDIDYAAGRISYESADKIIEYVKEKGLKVEWLIETHVHADHLSGAPYIQEKAGRQDRHRREHHHRAGHLRQDLQRRHRVPA